MATVLVIDDEEIYVELLKRWLQEGGHDPVCASCCEDGWSLLHKEEVDVVLLDVRMPGMSGMEFLKRIKEDPKLQHIPVIMQTAVVSTAKIIQGIKLGVYYYLVKPFEEALLLSIVSAAIEEIKLRADMSETLLQDIAALRLMKKGRFLFRTLEEAKSLAQLIAHPLGDSTQMATSIAEILINAVEHGNLGISYEEKSRLMQEGEWHAEVARRLDLEENRGRYAMLSVENRGESLHVTIEDSGKGFGWEPFLDFSAERMADPNGRGIAMARSMLPNLAYHGRGNKVTFSLSLKGAPSIESVRVPEPSPVG